MGAWPLSTTGLLDLRPALHVDLFKSYMEKASAPFVEFRAVLHPRAGGHPPPPITAAELHVRLRLGLVRWLLSWVRLDGSAYKRANHFRALHELTTATAQLCRLFTCKHDSLLDMTFTLQVLRCMTG